jgi:hypothetical protein
MPEDQILEVPYRDLVTAPARFGAGESVMPDESDLTVGDILHDLGALRPAAAELKAATSRAVNVYWLANHIQTPTGTLWRSSSTQAV